MGLAPGVVIRPVKTTIPKMGLPFELLAAKMQNIQQTKDAFDTLAELKPKALAMEGDQALLGKYNQYVEKIAGSVADAFASGDATKAQRMLSAAKTQLTREWKEGGVAFALKDRAEAMAKGMNEIAEREIGDDYKQMNKEVDLYRFKKGIQEIDYDLETGKYNRIGAAGMTTHVDLMAKAETYAKALGEDKRGYIDFIKAASGSRTNIMGLIHEEKVKDKKIQQQLQAYLSDPEVDAQLRLEQDWKNIRANRLDDPSKMISDASEYVNSEIDNLKNAVSDLEKMSITQQKYVLMQSGDYTGDFTATDNQALKDAKASYKEKINSSVKQRNEYIEKLNGNDVEMASGILFSYETADKYSKSFKNRFGITETVSNIQWPRAIDGGSNSVTTIKQIIDKAEVLPATTETQDVVSKIDESVNESEQNFIQATTELNGYFVANKETFKGLSEILDLEDKPTAKTEEDRQENIKRFIDNNKKITKIANVLDSNDSDDVKKQSIMSLFTVGAETADNIIKDYTDNKREIKQRSDAFRISVTNRDKALNIRNRFYNNLSQNLKDAIDEDKTLKNIRYNKNADGSLDLQIGGSGLTAATVSIPEEEIDYTVGKLVALSGKLKTGSALLPEDKDFLVKTFGNSMFQAKSGGGSTLLPGSSINDKSDYDRIARMIGNAVEEDALLTYTPIDTEYVVDKPISTKVNTGFSSMFNNLKAFVNNGYKTDYKTNDSTKLLDEEGNEHEIKDITKYEDNYRIGIDITGEPYIGVTAIVNEERRNFKLTLPTQTGIYEDVIKELEAEVFAGYTTSGNSTDLNRGLDNLSRLSRYNEDLSTGFVLDSNYKSHKNLDTQELSFTKDGNNIVLNLPGEELVSIESQTQANGTVVRGNYKIHKVSHNNAWRYYVTFNNEVQDVLTKSVGPNGFTFEPNTEIEPYTQSYDTALKQLLIYINADKFENAETAEEETLSILE